MLTADHLTKTIGKRTIVDDVSFSLQPGEVFGFLGPNGAGKTTTIRMLVGLIRPTSGRALVGGHDVHRDPTRARKLLGCIVETPDLYRFLTGRENLEHFARMLGPADPADIERVAAIVALDHRLDDKVRTYSLGMRQRLGIAQALLGHPRVLILDEPANGLDPAGIREMRQLLRRLAADGMTILVSSHLLGEIELLCDRVAIIHRGRILRVGSVKELVTGEELEIFVARPDDAAELLREHGLDVSVHENRVKLKETSNPTPALKVLLEGGFEILRVQPHSLTLEELFLAETHEETVD